jgi:hypothetical protein
VDAIHVVEGGAPSATHASAETASERRDMTRSSPEQGMMATEQRQRSRVRAFASGAGRWSLVGVVLALALVGFLAEWGRETGA